MRSSLVTAVAFDSPRACFKTDFAGFGGRRPCLSACVTAGASKAAATSCISGVTGREDILPGCVDGFHHESRAACGLLPVHSKSSSSSALRLRFRAMKKVIMIATTMTRPPTAMRAIAYGGKLR